jgi:hypothetical protein
VNERADHVSDAVEAPHLTADGQAVLDLRHRWVGVTTQVLFEPVELRERLQPAPQAAWDPGAGGAHAAPADQSPAVCPRCRDRFELIALRDPTVIRCVLRHLGLPLEVPTARPARPPPLHPTSRGDLGAPALPLGRSEPWCDADDVMVP